jgi:hypothetical protein
MHFNEHLDYRNAARCPDSPAPTWGTRRVSANQVRSPARSRRDQTRTLRQRNTKVNHQAINSMIAFGLVASPAAQSIILLI